MSPSTLKHGYALRHHPRPAVSTIFRTDSDTLSATMEGRDTTAPSYAAIIARLVDDPAATAQHAEALLRIADDFLTSADLGEEHAALRTEANANLEDFRLIEALKDNAVKSLKVAMLDAPRIDLPTYVENLRRAVLQALPPFQVEGRPEQIAAVRNAGKLIRDTVWALEPITEEVWGKVLNRFIARRLARLADTKRDGAGSIIEMLQEQWIEVAEAAALLAMERKAAQEVRTLPDSVARGFRRALTIALETSKRGTGNALVDKFAFHDGPMAKAIREYKLSDLDPFLIKVENLFNLAAHFRMYAHTLDDMRSMLGVNSKGRKPVHAETVELVDWAKAHRIGRRELARHLVSAGFAPDTNTSVPRDPTLTSDPDKAQEAEEIWENRLKSYW